MSSEFDLVVFGHGTPAYTLVGGVQWYRYFRSRRTRLLFNESVTSIIVTLVKAAGALDGIEALKKNAQRVSQGARAQEAKMLFDELIRRANELAEVLTVRNDAGKFPEGPGLRRIHTKLEQDVLDKLRAPLRSDDLDESDKISYVELKESVIKRVRQTIKEVRRDAKGGDS